MGSISKTAEAIKKLKSAVAAINDVADWLEANTNDSLPAKSDTVPEKPVHTLEEVRSVLAGKSGNGYTAQVRDLIHKYGAEKLSSVDPAHYDALIEEVEALGDDKG